MIKAIAITQGNLPAQVRSIMALLLAFISKKKQIRSAKLSQNINLGLVLCVFGSTDDYDNCVPCNSLSSAGLILATEWVTLANVGQLFQSSRLILIFLLDLCTLRTKVLPSSFFFGCFNQSQIGVAFQCLGWKDQSVPGKVTIGILWSFQVNFRTRCNHANVPLWLDLVETCHVGARVMKHMAKILPGTG